MAKKKSSTNYTPWIIGGVVVILLIWFVGSYNGLVNADVATDTAWGQVESVYQRRADLIPNVVETVKGFAAQEKDVFLKVTEARSAWTKQPSPQTAAGLEGALSRLLLVAERYPDLKSNQNFLALQDELAGTENRINVERQRYNKAVGTYNAKTRRFPTNIVAGMLGFEREKDFFEADAGAETVPEVAFT